MNEVEILREAQRKYMYDPVTGVFTWRIDTRKGTKVGEEAGVINGAGYRQIYIFGRIYLAHRIAWLYMHGKFPKAQIDHKNKCRSDNRLANLREATNKQNTENHSMRSDNTSGARGVFWHVKNKNWIARITHNGKQISLGSYSTVFQASDAYQAGALKLFTHQEKL